MTPEERLKQLGLVLPPPPSPAANYVESKRVGKLLYLAGHGPVGPDGKMVVGTVDSELDVGAAQQAARLTGLSLLSTMHAAVGLDSVVGVVSLLGFVNSAPGFTQQSEVIDGCSDLLVDVFGDGGRHTRSAVGVAELPFGIPVEIELVAQLR